MRLYSKKLSNKVRYIRITAKLNKESSIVLKEPGAPKQRAMSNSLFKRLLQIRWELRCALKPFYSIIPEPPYLIQLSRKPKCQK